MIRVNYSLTGAKELKGFFRRSPERLGWGLKKAALADIQEVMAESQGEVPVETGTLRDAAFIKQDSRGNITFGYDGKHLRPHGHSIVPTDEYMVAVHERLDVKHAEGKAKFLEDPVNRYQQRLEESLGNRVRKFFDFWR